MKIYFYIIAMMIKYLKIVNALHYYALHYITLHHINPFSNDSFSYYSNIFVYQNLNIQIFGIFRLHINLNSTFSMNTLIK